MAREKTGSYNEVKGWRKEEEGEEEEEEEEEEEDMKLKRAEKAVNANIASKTF